CRQYINIMKKVGALDNARVVGAHIVSRLRSLEKEHPGRISNVRGLGLMIAFDLQDKQTRDAMRKEFWDEGVIVLPSGQTGLRLRPALTISTEEADAFVDICGKVAKKVFAA
ncbi:MAG: aminotransferase class III-fold pyridoxal phosphate-dependent enzyme, partial [Planctomycetota bacterium]|nr:aminotransferase class III-fold pyridoxal phosphate-dependent enzyme [Planctomycetota bacterium]